MANVGGEVNISSRTKAKILPKVERVSAYERSQAACYGIKSSHYPPSPPNSFSDRFLDINCDTTIARMSFRSVSFRRAVSPHSDGLDDN